MSNPPELPEDDRGSVGSVGSGALFGGGVGTVLAVIAYNMGHDNPLKSWLTVLAPPFAVTITAI